MFHQSGEKGHLLIYKGVEKNDAPSIKIERQWRTVGNRQSHTMSQDANNTIIAPVLDARPGSIKHAWYSPTQESILKQTRKPKKDKGGTTAKGIPIYRDASGQPIRVTMVGDTVDHNTSFKDMAYMGEVSIFLGLGEFREDVR